MKRKPPRKTFAPRPRKPVHMTEDELHLVIQWGEAIKTLDGPKFSDPELELLRFLKLRRTTW